MFKRGLALLITIVSLFTFFCLTASANEDAVTYLYTNYCSSKLTISSLNATCKSELKGYSGTTTKIEVTQTLQVKNGAQWRKCESWSATYYGYYCYYTNSRSVYSGNQYRVKSEFKVYSGSNYENITVYSSTVST